MKKLHALMIATTAALPVFAAGGVLVSAATDSARPESSLVQKIATKFNLKTEDVQAVFDEVKTERKAEMDQRINDRLSEAVANGELSQEQADKITAKRAELSATREANREAWTTMSSEERRTLLQEQRDSLKAWAEENGIEMRWLSIGKGMMGDHRMGMRD